MTNKHSDHSEATMLAGAEDFKLIRGIGPGVAQRLHRAGVLTFAQLADMLPEEIAMLVSDLAGLSAQRIVKQDWIGQARALAREQALDKAEENQIPPTLRQHYATFTVELLLDEENDVRRTRVMHVQAGDEESWAGWEEARLSAFFVQRAGLIPTAAALIHPTVAQHDSAVPNEELRSSADEANEVVAIEVQPIQRTLVPRSTLHLTELAVVSADSESSHRLLQVGQPFDVRLSLDFKDVALDSPLNYTASIYAKSLDGRPRQLLGEAEGIIEQTGDVSIRVENMTLDLGIYRLEAALVATFSSSLPEQRPGLTAMFEGGLIRVY